jgi:hypothetical protein
VVQDTHVMRSRSAVPGDQRLNHECKVGIPWVAKITSGHSIFVLCCSGMGVSGCNTSQVSAIMIPGTSQCVHRSGPRRLKGRCRFIVAMVKGRSCIMDGRFYSSACGDRLNFTRANVPATRLICR